METVVIPDALFLYWIDWNIHIKRKHGLPLKQKKKTQAPLVKSTLLVFSAQL